MRSRRPSELLCVGVPSRLRTHSRASRFRCESALPLHLFLNEPERTFESFSLESESALSAMKKRRNGHVHHHTLKTIRAVVLGKDGVGKSGRFNISFV